MKYFLKFMLKLIFNVTNNLALCFLLLQKNMGSRIKV
jgi:hypothetical protein